MKIWGTDSSEGIQLYRRTREALSDFTTLNSLRWAIYYDGPYKYNTTYAVKSGWSIMASGDLQSLKLNYISATWNQVRVGNETNDNRDLSACRLYSVRLWKSLWWTGIEPSVGGSVPCWTAEALCPTGEPPAWVKKWSKLCHRGCSITSFVIACHKQSVDWSESSLRRYG